MITRSQTLNERLKIPSPSHLFHYTDSTGLIGILDSEEIWATNIRFLNDINEVIEATEAAQKILLELHKSSNNHKEKSLFKSMLDNINEVASHTYVCSFSEDDDSLSQWRAYCPPSGGGYALGIPSLQLSAQAKEQGWMFIKCIYDDVTKNQVVKEIIDSMLIDFKDGLKQNISLKEQDELTEKVASNFQLNLLAISGAIKNKAFKIESEWRLISPLSTDEKKIRFRKGKSGIIPYCTFKLLSNLNPKTKNLIKLVAGPTPQNDSESRQAARYILSRYLDNSTGESLSKIPYKGW
ncbi:DUF2971 domain-containing protein [Rhodohalobacter mucosus]|uniref:DUF2971 domain-containing protein n=1 Tax=Rhodohalobacter mucosus TaxID=2079485 RepID=A0A316TRL3_9BACT|nr:DUF2971 domain-containing protein [Rhodohalobacter mucosus]PWN05939.1 hypothetical protein DDZ15_12200 [Rhodohalobacter mucosus]